MTINNNVCDGCGEISDELRECPECAENLCPTCFGDQDEYECTSCRAEGDE